jgi:carbonic anhydrase/acetyltransferase-like protein (isoleucine patch superfamily)
MFKKVVAVFCVLLPSGPTRLLYRLCGHRIGRNVKMPPLSFVYSDEMTIGPDVVFRNLVYVNVRTLSIGASTIVSYGTQIKGDNSFSCGERCFLGLQCVINCHDRVTLGDYSGLGPRCTVYSHGSFLPVTLGYPAKFAPVIIDDYVWIAMEVTVMPGVRIGRNCIINPGVVVQGTIKPNSLVRLDSQQLVVQDMGLLQKLWRRDPPYWHHKILSEFLASESVSYEYSPAENLYSVPGRYAFTSDTEANTIELHMGRDRILYDLASFTADDCRRAIHARFLRYLRLHFGITLIIRRERP